MPMQVLASKLNFALSLGGVSSHTMAYLFFRARAEPTGSYKLITESTTDLF